MNQNQFSALLTLIVPQVVRLIVEKEFVDEIAATKSFYESEVYALLEEEETKIWHFSPLTLYNMYEEEKQTGHITFPEEM